MPGNTNDRPQIFQTLPTEDMITEIEGSLATRSLILPPPSVSTQPDMSYTNNTEFWRAVFAQEVRSDRTITLHSFFLFEWLPRSPGLFHTRLGEENRRWASDHILQLDEEELRIYEESAPLDPVVLDLYGKICMLQGGIGCIRLKPSQTDVGLLWFMSASSTLSAHEGIPVAITEGHYNQYIDYINQHGVLPCSLVGKLKFVPERLLSLYRGYSGVPQLYLLVEEIQPLRSPLELRDGGPVVSAAVTFRTIEHYPIGGTYFDSTNLSAAYISFSPGLKDSLEKRLSWLEHYVSMLHNGTIITDFDEHMTRFRGAVFSLDKVRNGQLDSTEVASVVNYIQIGNADVLMESQHAQISANQVTVRKIMGDVFKNIGTGATIINRSNLINAMNNTNSGADPNLADALKQLADLIEKSGNSDAADNFNAFTEELQKPSPRKSLLKSFWDGMLAALPTIAELTTAAGTIALLVK
jgi:hypothetical protein